MRALALWCLALVLLVVLGSADEFGFVGNATTISDPDGVLNYRFVSFNLSRADKNVWFTSVRSSPPPGALHPEIDTLGGYISFRSLPMAFFGYWNYNISLNPGEIDVDQLTEAMAIGYTTLIERDESGNVVRSFALAQATSNTSAGVEWDVVAGCDPLLHWLNMSARIHVPPNNVFKIEIFWFISSVLGQLDLGDTDISPRMIESVIRISDYPYLTPSHSLSLRVVCAYDTMDFTTTRGRIAGGTGLDQIYVNLVPAFQNPFGPNQKTGPEFNASISDWQSSSGLRNAISNSFVGELLNERFGGNWDVQIADVAFQPGMSNIIYDPTIGSGYSMNPASAPSPPYANSELAPSGASTSKQAFLSHFLLLIAVLVVILL